MNADGFMLVSKRRRARYKSFGINLDKPELSQSSAEDSTVKIWKAKEKLLHSCGYSDLEESLKRVKCQLESQFPNDPQISSIVCYGLGLPSRNWISCYQTGLLIILKDYFKALVEIYDPAFTDIDVEVLTKLGFVIIKKNEEGKREVKVPTLFYMPHCGKGLYNNLLWTNWNYENLSRCVIIGNSFSAITRNIPGRILQKYYRYIYLSTNIFQEYPVRSLVKEDNIFNDISIHVIKIDLRNSDLSPDFWSVESELEYESDVEFIRVM